MKNLIVEVNSIGDSQCRPYYKKVLVNYLKPLRNSLCSDCKRRLRENPLRILDCKDEKCQRIIKKGAPQFLDHVCKDCSNHFKNVLETLEELEIPYKLNPYLVRGLDYYTRTVFEFFHESEEGKSQIAVVAGGRYDDLVKLLGGKPTPACGGALGLERVVNLIKKESKKISKPSPTKIFLAQVGTLAKRKALKLFEEFLKEKIKVGESLNKDSLSLQLKIADKMNVKYVLILGQKEALEGKIIVRDMKQGSQRTVAMEKVIGEMKRKIKK